MNDAYRTGDFRRVIAEFLDPEIVLKPAGILPEGGRANFSGLPVEFSFVHVGTYRDGKIVRLDVYANLDDALEAAGLEE